jgi:hypothetical protein
MQQEDAAARLRTYRYELAQLTGWEHDVIGQDTPSFIRLDSCHMNAMTCFEEVVVQAPSRQWLEEVAAGAGLNLEVVARSVLVARARLFWVVWHTVGFPTRTPRTARMWWRECRDLVVLLGCIGIGYLVYCLLSLIFRMPSCHENELLD